VLLFVILRGQAALLYASLCVCGRSSSSHALSASSQAWPGYTQQLATCRRLPRLFHFVDHWISTLLDARSTKSLLTNQAAPAPDLRKQAAEF